MYFEKKLDYTLLFLTIYFEVQPYPFNIFSSGITSFAAEPNLTQQTEVDTLKSDNIADYLGANTGYYKLLDHFTKLYETKYKKDIKKFIQEEVPPTVDGQVGSQYHGIIQTGYGYSVGCDQVIYLI